MGLIERIGRAGGVQLARAAMARAARGALASAGSALAGAPNQSALEWGWYYPEDGQASATTGPSPTAATANLVEETLGGIAGVSQAADADGLTADLSATRDAALPAGTYALHALIHFPAGASDTGAGYVARVSKSGNEGTEFFALGCNLSSAGATSRARMEYDSAGTILRSRVSGTNPVYAEDTWGVIGGRLTVTDASNWATELWLDGTISAGTGESRTGAAPHVNQVDVLSPGSSASSTEAVVAAVLWYAAPGASSLDASHMAAVSSFLLGLTA